MADSPDISFVCCIEAGVLESQTMRMVHSLRQYGGRFANVPVYAVTPRRGPALSAATRRLLAEQKVTHLQHHYPSGYEWFNFINKPLALQAAEKHITTATSAWLDSDIVFVGEPTELELAPGEDFTGFPVEVKEMGTTGPGDTFEPLWRKSCEVIGLDLDSLPFVTTELTKERVRLYFDGGIFTYRRSSGFARSYLDLCVSLLDSRIGIAAQGYNLGFKEMSSIGFAVIKLGLNWRPLSYSHDFQMMSTIHAAHFRSDELRSARVVHYHDMMWPPMWPTFRDCMRGTHPEVARWLESLGPMRNDAGIAARLIARWLKYLRGKRAAAYARSSILVDAV